MSDDEREDLVAFLDANPEAGKITPETSCARLNRAKAGSGGRVIASS
jgi:hypothetical protein